MRSSIISSGSRSPNAAAHRRGASARTRHRARRGSEPARQDGGRDGNDCDGLAGPDEIARGEAPDEPARTGTGAVRAKAAQGRLAHAVSRRVDMDGDGALLRGVVATASSASPMATMRARGGGSAGAPACGRGSERRGPIAPRTGSDERVWGWRVMRAAASLRGFERGGMSPSSRAVQPRADNDTAIAPAWRRTRPRPSPRSAES